MDFDTKIFPQLPETVCRGIEVATCAGFRFALVDITKNGYYMGMPLIVHRDFPEPKLNLLLMVEDSPCDIDYFDTKSRESWETAYSRVKTYEEYILEGRTPETIYASLSRSEPSLRLIRKAVSSLDATWIEIRNCLMLADAIRRLDHEPQMIRSHYVAEAVQYAFPRDTEN